MCCLFTFLYEEKIDKRRRNSHCLTGNLRWLSGKSKSHRLSLSLECAPFHLPLEFQEKLEISTLHYFSRKYSSGLLIKDFKTICSTKNSVPPLKFPDQKFEIQTKSGPKFLENHTKSRPNLTLFQTDFTKTELIQTFGRFYHFKAAYQ